MLRSVSEPSIEEVWLQYRESGGQELRDRIVEHYLPLVQHVAKRMAVGLPPSVEQSDLVSYGVFGLMNAIDRFDLDRGFKFETFAIARVKGAMLDELRAVDWVPRSVRARVRAIDRATTKLEGDLRRVPTAAEVAAELGLTGEQFQAAVGQTVALGQASLDDIVPGGDGDTSTLADTVADARVGPAVSYELEEVRALLVDAIFQVSDRETLILALYYGCGLTFAEVGVVLGVTESRICQIHTKALAQARLRLIVDDER